MKRALAAGWVALLVATAAPSTTEPLTNADVEALVAAGLSDEVVVAKVRQAPKVAFALDTESIVALKEAGVPEPVITAMLERSTPAAAPAAPAAPVMLPGFQAARAWLRTGGRDVALPLSRGTLDSTGNALSFGLGKRYATYAGLAASVRTSDRRPSVVLEDPIDPRERYLIVRLIVREKSNDRAVRLGSLKRAFGHFKSRAHETMKPPESWIVAYTVEPEGDGRWLMRPEADLPRGEYGLFSYRGQALDSLGLFAFGVE